MLTEPHGDYDFLPTIGFEFVQGRNFSQDIPSDSNNFIITQSAADLLGFTNPLGQTIKYDMYHNQEGKIAGVIKGFHNDDIHLPMNPVIFSFGKKDQFYQEMLLRKLSVFFTIIAVIIACLGLFGLTMFNAQRRTKEIGVRKVLGASVIQVVFMLCRDFTRPIMISFLLAFPIAYYVWYDAIFGKLCLSDHHLGFFFSYGWISHDRNCHSHSILSILSSGSEKSC